MTASVKRHSKAPAPHGVNEISGGIEAYFGMIADLFSTSGHCLCLLNTNGNSVEAMMRNRGALSRFVSALEAAPEPAPESA